MKQIIRICIYSEGFDSLQDKKRLPTNYTGGIWINRIDIVH